MQLVTLALKTLISISQNGINQITLNKQLGSNLNKDNVNASNYLYSLADAAINRIDPFSCVALAKWQYLRQVGQLLLPFLQ